MQQQKNNSPQAQQIVPTVLYVRTKDGCFVPINITIAGGQSFITGYEVNELMWPMATPFPTIRKINEQEWRCNLARWHRYSKRAVAKQTR